MSRARPLRLSLVASAAIAATLLLISCLDDPSGPRYETGYLALAPSFRGDLIGLVDLDRDRHHLEVTEQTHLTNGRCAMMGR